MTKISNRALKMPESPIRKLMPYAKKAEKEGKKVFYLNIGQPDIDSPQCAIDALKNWQKNILSYTSSEGTQEYRDALSHYYNERNIPISADEIISTNGGSEALFFTFNAIADVGDEIIVPEPFYANYNGFANETDVKFVPVTSHIEDGFALPPIADFEKLITPKTKAILICSPSNPTGYMYSHEELEQLKDLALKHDLFVITDEVYREFSYEQEHTSIMHFPELAQNAIIIDSESKRFSMCGIRLGSVASKNKEFIANVLKYGQARLSPCVTSQKLGAVALNNAHEYLKEANAEYKKRRDFMVERLNQIPGVVCPKPTGAFYCAVQLPVDDAEKFAVWLLQDFAHNGNTVMFAPMQGFYFTPNLGKNQARLAYVLNTEDLKLALEALEVALKEYPNNTL
ncbi:pyridoxal phosphate-dependent aminotransferase [Ornithobacterium rhinotracheale]|uniref:pyridoxal phosphate-dependent aminotransferase n=1 Tax=Ornithobacterium rhinotracheale TaxID=28251 RepID=UPI00129CF8BD|nr:pyridoxal phosphate-dependent aminotransferase [Ornithobacterium rhinotracheale]MRJ07838.1 pyridoxal phosphate-dependent aminotransferase [Ornithobacterium rhinotracheale]UOH78647.1 pyridoxal phosphate-dependent aminotransferase [Ornithobacterium rhinotracheale]